MIDFEFNGELLSEHGCALGYTDSSSSSSTEGGVSLTTVKNNDIDMLISRQYQNTLTKTFDIIKMSCISGGYDYFTDYDREYLLVWLSQPGFHEFRPIYDNSDIVDVLFFGMFTNITEIALCDKIIGYTVTFTTNAPYGFGYPVEGSVTLNSSNNNFEILNDSQEIGNLYFDEFKVKCGANGELILTNNQDESTRRTRITNCKANEVIDFDCKNKLITSSLSHDKLYNDYNYKWPRLYRDYLVTHNKFTLDTSKMASATITYKYYPIRKVGQIV